MIPPMKDTPSNERPVGAGVGAAVVVVGDVVITGLCVEP